MRTGSEETTCTIEGDGTPNCWRLRTLRALAEISKGSKFRNDFESEKNAVKYARRSIIANKDIEINEKISKEMLSIKRPATGIPPKFFDKIIGKSAKRKIQEDKPIQWDDLNE